MKTNSRKNIIIIVLTLAIIMIIGILFSSYGFVSSRVVDNKLSKNKTYINQKLSLNFSDGSEQLISNNESFIPGSTIVKKFTIKNTGNVLINYSINLTDIANTFVRESDIEYELKVGDKVVDSNIFPKEDSFLLSKETLNVDEEREYILTIKYLESEENQIVDQGKTISGKITIDEHFKSIKTLKIYGNSYQDTVASIDMPSEIKSLGTTKNLLNYRDFIKSGVSHEIENGIQFETLTGTYDVTIDFTFKANTTYILSADVTGVAYFGGQIHTSDEANPLKNYIWIAEQGSKSLTIRNTSNEDITRTIYCRLLDSTTDIISTVKNIQLEIASTKTEYESYGKYTIPIEIGPENIYNYEDFYKNVKNDGYPLYEFNNGIKITNWYQTISIVPNNLFKPNTTYEISRKLKVNNGTTNYATARMVLATEKTSGGFILIDGNKVSATFKTPTDLSKHVYLWTYGLSNGGEIEITNLIIREPGEKRYLKVYLSAPLRYVGDCENCSDYLDINNNKLVRNVGVIESYNGEDIGSQYISSTGELSTGATVLYKMDSPTEEYINLFNIKKIKFKDNESILPCSDNDICASNVEVEYYE